MIRFFVQTTQFSEILDQLIEQRKLVWEDYLELENDLLKNPDEGEVITGTGGLRKTRLKSSTKGKSGGFRVCYLDVPSKAKIIFIYLYQKNEKEDLSNADKKVLRKLVDTLKGE